MIFLSSPFRPYYDGKRIYNPPTSGTHSPRRFATHPPFPAKVACGNPVKRQVRPLYSRKRQTRPSFANDLGPQVPHQVQRNCTRAASNHPGRATAPQITEINRQFLADQKEFALYISVAANLKRHLIKPVPAIYLAALRHPINNFLCVSVLAILDHLDTTYGKITSNNLAKNLLNMHRKWSSTQPLESLWDNKNQCRHMALTLDPISDRATVQAALNNLNCTGVFIDAVKLWCLRPEVDCTYNKICEHYTLANLERQRELTAKSAGYHGTSLAATGNIPGNIPA
jgi:hypothetical protein